MNSFDVVIVGGGAAGLATGIFTAAKRPELRIAILDGAKKLGAKILVSGGGRCNVTNVRVGPEDFWGGSRNSIRSVLRAFPAEQTVAFFRGLGVELHQEQWGKLFPDSNSAKTVLNALLREADRRGVKVLADHKVVGVQREPESGFFVQATTGGGEAAFTTRVVVLATGGKSLPKTGSDGGGYELARSLGHAILPTTPGLAPLVLDGDFHTALSGVSHEVEVTVRVADVKPIRLTGPMLWTHFGVSGPAILDASRHWHRAKLESMEVRVSLNFLPGSDIEAAERRLLELAQAQPKSLVRSVLGNLGVGPRHADSADLLPDRLAAAVLSRSGLYPQLTMGQLSREERRRILHALLDWPLAVRDSRGFNHAEVTAGGVPLNEIDPSTLVSRVCHGLFLVGEILDVDGRIGGFNFQWAWSSGFVAAEGISRFLPKA